MFINIFILLRFLFNHFINVPLNLLIGSGEIAAFIIAFVIDILQIVFYFRILGNEISTKLRNLIIKNLPVQERIRFSPVVRTLQRFGYFGVFLLAAMPIYVGGIWSAVVTSIALSLDRKKSYLCLVTGSLVGCVLWVMGLIYILAGLKYLMGFISMFFC